MAEFEKVGRAHVLRAIGEYDLMGAEAFLDKHGFPRDREYALIHARREYDSKAILGVAHLHAVGSVVGPEEFSGGREGAAKDLQHLGFRVVYRGTKPAEDPERIVDASDLGSDDASSAWAIAAREVLLETASSYHAVVTNKELSTAVMRMTGVHTKRAAHYWIGDVLGRVAQDCESRGEPLLSALSVNAQGSVGESYALAVLAARGTRPVDPDLHAAAERLECYRRFGATLPVGGGEPALTAQVKSGRARAKKLRQAERVQPICPICHLAIPPTGVCDNCA